MQLGVSLAMQLCASVNDVAQCVRTFCPATACPQPLPFPDFVLAVQS